MTRLITPRFLRLLRSLVVSAFLVLAPLLAYPQVTLTGAILFATDSTGAFSLNQSWNTLGGDPCWDLWLALNPDASSPLNGPSDAQASINLPLTASNSYMFYMFGAPDLAISTDGLNLFFDGNNSSPAISVFGPTNSTLFTPNSSSGTRTLAGGVVTGSGSMHYAASDVVAVLTGYSWNSPATPPGDVAQAFAFTPGGGVSFFGWFTLQVFPAATLTSNLSSASPGTTSTLKGRAFAPRETVKIYFSSLNSSPVATTTTDGAGAFTIAARVPSAPYGPKDVYAVGETSGKLGATSIFVTPAIVIKPHRADPGGSAAVQGLGFGASEPVAVYWANPRQLVGTAFTDSSGTFVHSGALQITVPASAPPGRNAVTATGQTTGAVAIGQIIVR